MSDDTHSNQPELVIAILNWNGYALTRACIESLGLLAGPAHRILVVDNGSAEPEAARLAAEFEGKVEALALPRNLGVGGGYNAAIAWARARGSKYVLLMNNDTLLDDPRMAERLIEACGPTVFAVGPLVKDRTGRVWSSGGTFDWKTYMSGHTQAEGIKSTTSPYPVAWIDGSCMLLSVAAACQLGGFDEVFFLYWEEVDLCIRAGRRGLSCLVDPRTSITHLVNQSARPSQIDHLMMRNAILFMRRNGTRRQNAGLLLRMLFHRMPLFAARRIKHGGGIRSSLGMVLSSIGWNLWDAVRKHGWRYKAGGSLVRDAADMAPSSLTATSAVTSRPPLRILAIGPYAAYPAFGGGKMRIFHLLSEWMRLGHEVTMWVAPLDEPELAWSDDGPRPQLLALPALTRDSIRSKLAGLVSPLPDEVWSRPPLGFETNREVLRRFDIVVLMQAHVGRYAAAFIEAGVPVILDQQNVESDISKDVARLRWTRMGRARGRLDVWKWRRYERQLVRRVRRTIAVSEADAGAFRALVPSASVGVRPSGADLRSLRYVDHAENRGDGLIMTGTLGYLPNLDAAQWMVERILPRVRQVRPSAHLVLVGASPPESLRRLGGDAVEIVGRVPDVRPYLEAADLFVAPLRAGGGTRLKLLEAFAVGLPTVGTRLASDGIAVRHGIDIATADDEETFADEVVRLLQDAPARRAMAESARRLVEQRYDWRTIATDYQDDLYAVVGDSRS